MNSRDALHRMTEIERDLAERFKRLPPNENKTANFAYLCFVLAGIFGVILVVSLTCYWITAK